MKHTWTEIEKKFIRDNAEKMKDKDLADKLSRISKRSVTMNAVRKQRQKMGIKKVNGRGKCGLKENKMNNTSSAIARSVQRGN